MPRWHHTYILRSSPTVIVPEGAEPGQTLMVRSPDGQQLTYAVVPPESEAGDSFSVQFPTYNPDEIVIDAEAAQPKGCGSALESLLLPTPELVQVTAVYDEPDDTVERRAGGDSDRAAGDERDADGREDPSGLGNFLQNIMSAVSEDESAYGNIEKKESKSAKTATTKPDTIDAKDELSVEVLTEHKLLLVQVPRGLPAGATLHVEIPGENRTVEATVPEGVTSFHIAYTPRARRTAAAQPRPESLLKSARKVTPMAPMPEDKPESDGKRQKLLLVRVPPGTPAGTTIHVSVPDEPGRILAAMVPSGDIREFHVSYESKVGVDPPPLRSFLPTFSPYQNGI